MTNDETSWSAKGDASNNVMANRTGGPTRREFLQTLSLLGLTAIAGCKAVPRPLKIVAGRWPGYEPLFLAQHLGWLEPEIVHVAEVPSNSSSLRALSSGVVQGAALTLDEVLRARSLGLPLTVAMVFDTSEGADMLLARPAIRSLRELKGKRIGLDEGTNAGLLLATLLEKADLKNSEVTSVMLAFGNQEQAWKTHEVDAIVTYEPIAGRLLARGARRLFDSRQIPDTIVDVLALRSDFLPEFNPTALRHLTAAFFAALRYWQQHRVEAIEAMSGHLNVSTTELKRIFEGIAFADVHKNRRLISGPDATLRSRARLISAYMKRSGIVEKEDDLKDLLTDRFLP